MNQVKKDAFLEVIEILECRNEEILKNSNTQTKREFRVMCIKLGENNNTINLIQNLINANQRKDCKGLRKTIKNR